MGYKVEVAACIAPVCLGAVWSLSPLRKGWRRKEAQSIPSRNPEAEDGSQAAGHAIALSLQSTTWVWITKALGYHRVPSAA